MIIIPLEKSIDWKRPPLVTLFLVIINTFILFGVQEDDHTHLEQAIKFYFESNLPKWELTAYLVRLEAGGDVSREQLDAWHGHLERHLEKNGNKTTREGEESEFLLDNMGDLVLANLLMRMEGDELFMQRLREEQVITPRHEGFPAWKSARQQYEKLKRGSVSWQYGFVPAEHRPITFLTHMFLHGGVGHLVGNMLFLFLIGFALETAFGSLRYLLLYLLGGLGAVTLFWLIYPQTTIPLVGASGAIAGLMGLYAVTFGLRKIRFFYSILFYFDYVKAPAIIMLPLWLANEFYQLYWGGVSNVAYVAHIGGLVTGGLLALPLKRLAPQWINTEYLDEAEQQETRQQRFEEGRRLLGALEIDKARVIFLEMYKENPGDPEVLTQLYNVLKLQPEHPEYHRVTRELLSESVKNPDEARKLHELFNEYLKIGKGKLRLEPALLLKLANSFARHGYPSDAERILASLLRKRRDFSGLDHALLALGVAWQREQKTQKQQTCLSLLQKHFPDSPATESARQILK